MDFFVGTSGWYYSWNEERSLDWFVANSGLNAVELNASFYRFPFPSMVKSWAKKGAGLRWAVKVNRLITHQFKFSEGAYSTWQKFRDLFMPLDANVDFYLFQLHPRLTPESAVAIEEFAEKTGLQKRFALEPRNQEWFKDEWVRWAKNLGITWVSVDSPDFPLTVQNTNGLVYERMHGRTAWYSHHYTDEELEEVAEKILRAKPEKAYVFFNNDTAMLVNARKMLELLRNRRH
ncbi:MAG: DUF72 domain-containing protein [Candidatus Bathyarchaeota archaeon]|nr:DUF72 domain-containing protein [Candidatus Bathyarchaeota archaeon]